MAHHDILEVAREPGAVAGERHALHVRAVHRAARPPEPAADLEPPEAEIHRPSDRVVILHALARHRRVGALRADEPLAAQRDPDDHPVGLEANLLDPYPGQVQQAREC